MPIVPAVAGNVNHTMPKRRVARVTHDSSDTSTAYLPDATLTIRETNERR